MPTTITFQPTTPLDAATQTVYTRATWGTAWNAEPNLHCVRLTIAAAPSTGSAEFVYRYGFRLKSTESAFTQVNRFAPSPRSYVRVVIAATEGEATGVDWVGVWRSASDVGLSQRFVADSIEALLAGSVVRDAYYRDVFGATRQAKYGMIFNEGGKPNRSQMKLNVRDGDAYVFDVDPARAQYWSTRDIVEYLVEAHPPLDANDVPLFAWTLSNAEDNLPSFDRPTIETHGKDVLSLLQSIISRFRLLSFVPRITETVDSGTKVALDIFTFTSSAISITNINSQVVASIPANTNTRNLNFVRDPSSRASLSIAANHVADRVTVVGGMRASVCSLSNADSSLGKGWEPLAEQLYRLPETDPFLTLPDRATERREYDEIVARHRNSREFADVFARFIIPKYWDQLAGNGEGAGDNPLAVDDATGEQYLLPVLRLIPSLPFLSGYVYTDTTIADLETAETRGHRGTKTGKPPHEQLPILVVLKHRDDSNRWSSLEQLANLTSYETYDLESDDYVEHKAVAHRWQGRVSTLSDGLGLRLEVSGDRQDVIAAIDMAGHRDLIPGSFAWQEMIATVAFYDPRGIRVSYPPEDEAVVPLGEFVNEKTIEVGDEYQLIRVLPQTVLDAAGGGDLKRTTGGLLRDDRDFLRYLAQRAYEWHKVPRYALTFSTGLVSGRLRVGDYIVDVWDGTRLLDVDSVVTELTYEFPVGKPSSPPTSRMSAATSFAELDPTRFL